MKTGKLPVTKKKKREQDLFQMLQLGQLTPIFVEKLSGDQMAGELEKMHGGIAPEKPLQEYVNFVGQRVLANSLRSDFPHKFTVLNSPKIVNAFALGNGNVYVTKALLNLLDDEAELAEVLGHENGHIGYRHIASRIDQSVGVTALMAVAEAFLQAKKGGVSQEQQEMISKANAVIPGLILNGFGREQEIEADEHGLEAMVKAGYDPGGAVRLFERFQKLEPKVSGLQAYMSSHPTAKRRIEEVKADIFRMFPSVKGEAFRDRYQKAVKGTLSDGSGIPEGVPILVSAGIAVLIVGAVAVVVTSL